MSSGYKTQGPVCGHPNDYLAEEPVMTMENADARQVSVKALLEAIGKLDKRYARDESGREVVGAHYVKRDDVVELLLRS
jgi:hypothetical protein